MSHPAGSLQGLAGPSGVLIGTALDSAALTAEAPYRDTLAKDFGIVTPENDMKWGLIHPERDWYDFAKANQIVDFAQAHVQQVHGTQPRVTQPESGLSRARDVHPRRAVPDTP